MVRVYCQPDRPKGRGKKVIAPPVKELALERAIPVHQPLKLKDGRVASELATDEIDLAVVVAYGRILPPAVFEAPKSDTWNVHASLLPKYRGASPIQHAILNGETTTGVTLMQLREGLDEGPMLLKREIEIKERETSGQLTERLALVGARALVDGIRLAKDQGLNVEPQNPAEVSFAPLIQKTDGILNFEESAQALERKICGLSPWPGTFVPTPKGPLKILAGRYVPEKTSVTPGHIESLSPLRIATGHGLLEIQQLQAPGKNPNQSADFLRGTGRTLKSGSAFPGDI